MKWIEDKRKSRVWKKEKALASAFALMIVFSIFALASAVQAKDFVIRNTSDATQNYFVVNGTDGDVTIGTNAYFTDENIIFNRPLSINTSGPLSVSQGIDLTDPTSNTIDSYSPLYIKTSSGTAADIVLQPTGVVGLQANLDMGGYNIINLGTLTNAGGWTDDGTNVRLTTSTDKVGIGTTSPDTVLEVQGSSDNQVLQLTATDDDKMLYVNTAGSQPYLEMYADGGSTVKVKLDTNGVSYLSNDLAVGTGSTDNARLMVLGTVFPIMRINNHDVGEDTGIRLKSTVAGPNYFHSDIFTVATGSETGRLGIRVPYTAERLSILSSGEVGIGTASPAQKLHVSGGHLKVTRSSDPTLFLENTNSGDTANIYRGGGELVIDPGSNENYNLVSTGYIYNSNADIYINDNVGIGVASPAAKFHVASGTADEVADFQSSDNSARIRIRDDDTTAYVIAEGSTAQIGMTSTSSTNNLVVDSSGEVGINTTSPGSVLAVVGQTSIGEASSGNSAPMLWVKPNQALAYGGIVVEAPFGSVEWLTMTHNGTKGLIETNYLGGGSATDLELRAYAQFDQLVLETDGDVGIGEANPAKKFTVGHSGGQGGYLGVSTLADAGLGDSSLIEFREATGTSGAAILYSGGSSAPTIGGRQFKGAPANNLYLLVNDGSKDMIGLAIERDSGEVGIGTATPEQRLDINGSSAQYIKITSVDNAAGIKIRSDQTNEATIYSPDGTDDLRFSTDSTTDALTISNAGYIGIGGASPSELLHLYKVGTSTEPALKIEGYDPQLIIDKTDDTRTSSVVFLNAADGNQMTMNQLSNRFRFRDYANEPIEFWTNNNERVRIEADGDVGIGTTSPDALLEISRTTPGEVLRLTSSDYTPDEVISFNIDSLGLTLKDQAGDTNFRVSENGGIAVGTMYSAGYFNSPTNGAMIEGNVGIGTVSPQRALHVNATSNQLRLEEFDNSKYWELDADGNDLNIIEDGNIRMQIETGGNVGIGTTNPAYPLDVQKSASGNNILARFYNGDYTAGTRGAIRVHQQVAVSGWYSAYLGVDKDSSNVFLSNDAITANHLTIDTAGDVGIGTTNAGEKLEVSGGNVRIDGDGVTDPYLIMKSSAGATRVFLDTEGNSYLNGGNIGIGTASPAYKLDVSGDTRVGGNLYLKGNLTTLNVQQLQINGSLIPPQDNQFDVGNATFRWNDVYARGGVFTSAIRGISGDNYLSIYAPDSTEMGRVWNSALYLKNVYPMTTSDLGSATYKWDHAYVGTLHADAGVIGATQFTGDIYPDAANKDVGTSGNRWRHFYSDGGYIVGPAAWYNDANNQGITIRAGGLAAGTGAYMMMNDPATGSGAFQFYTHITADSTEAIRLSIPGGAAQGSAAITTYEDIVPSADAGTSLGTTSKRWDTLYTVNIDGNGNEINFDDMIDMKGNQIRLNSQGSGAAIYSDGSHMDIYSATAGGDFRVYSLNRAALKFAVDADTGDILSHGTRPVNARKTASVTQGWWRIASAGTSSDDFTGDAQFTVSERHMSMTFRISAAFNDEEGISFTMLGRNAGSWSPVISKVRIVEGDTYDNMFLEVYADASDDIAYSVFDEGSYYDPGWHLMTATAGSVPGGYTAHEYDVVGSVFMVGDEDPLFTVEKDGNVGIGTTSPEGSLTIGTVSTDPTFTISRASIFLESWGGIIWDNSTAAASRKWAIRNEDTASGDFAIITESTKGGGLDTRRFYIDAAGEVGIGTTSPGGKLQVEDTSAAQQLSLVYTGQGTFRLGVDSSGQFIVDPISSLDRKFIVQNSGAGSQEFIVSGNVGIGTTSPKSKFQIDDRFSIIGDVTGNEHIGNNFYYSSGFKHLVNDEAAMLAFNDDGSIQFYDDAAGTADSAISWDSNMIIDADGDVGIGDMTPDAKLDVDGDVSITNAANGIHLSSNYDTSYGIRLVPVDNGVNGHELRIRGRTTSTGAFSDLVTVENNGEVGIGTVDPTGRLDVKSSGLSSEVFQAIASDGSVLFDIEESGSPGHAWVAVRNSGGTAKIVLSPYSSSYFTGGSLGIGTSSPGKKLEVSENVDGEAEVLQLTNAHGGQMSNVTMNFKGGAGVVTSQITSYVGETSNNGGALAFSLRDGATGNHNVDMVIKKSGSVGRVGIGDTSPDAKLDVEGKLRVGSQESIVLSNAETAQENYGLRSIADDFELYEPEDGNKLIYKVYDQGTTYNQQFFYDGTNTALYLKNDGTVGIGTNSPTAKMDVVGTVRATGQGNPTAGAGLELAYTGGTGTIYSYDRGGSAFKAMDFVASDYSFFAGTGEDLTIDSAGDVGIGDTSPSTALSLGGTGSANGITFGDDAADPANLYRSEANRLKTDDSLQVQGTIYTGTISPLASNIQLTGNVGIGTTSPNSALDLEGDGSANGITFGASNDAQIYWDGTNSRMVIEVT